MSTLIKPIEKEAQAKRGWIVEVDGKVLPEVSLVKISNPKFGVLTYGMTPPGFDGWAYAENGGGGSVIVPFTKHGDEIYVGVVEEARHNQGGKVLNLPRGYLEPGKSHFETAMIKVTDKVGKTFEQKRVSPMIGLPKNPNNAHFETVGEDHGVHYYSLFIFDDELVKDGEYLVFKPGTVNPVSPVAQKVFKSRFIPWWQATELADDFTCSGVAQLLASIRKGINIER